MWLWFFWLGFVGFFYSNVLSASPICSLIYPCVLNINIAITDQELGGEWCKEMLKQHC